MEIKIAITDTSTVTPGIVATLNPGDELYVHQEARLRNDWGSFHVAIMTAWTRGARVSLER